MLLGRNDRRRLDPGTDALELAQRVGASGCLSPAGGVGRAIDRAGLGRSLLRAVWFRPALGVGPAVSVGFGVVLKVPSPIRTDRDVMEDDLVASGRFVRIETRGERTGLDRPVTVGFTDDTSGPAGAVLVAAGSADAAWARNLRADPSCHVSLADRSFDAVAEPLTPAEHAAAIRELILRYGTPAEGLGHGPSFRLRPVAEGPT